MRTHRVFVLALGLGRTVVERVTVEGEVVVVHARPVARARSRCGVCGRRSPGYDAGEGRRRWRALDLGRARVYVEAEAPRVVCREHGVVVARVPWARHGSRFTRDLEETAAWLATQCSRSAVCELLRVSWRAVGTMLERVVAERRAQLGDPLEGLRRVGIDELSFRRGHRYLTAVVDHDRGRLVWAQEGRDKATVERFCAALGEERAQRVDLVSSDMGAWQLQVIAQRLPAAVVCLDPFHVVKLATAAVDEVRREIWNELRRGGGDLASWHRGLRWALRKRPERLTDRQRASLAEIQQTNRRLWRAYLLKEQLRAVFAAEPGEGIRLLERWLAWAQRSRLPAFVRLARTIREHRAGIEATLTHGLSNARAEALNTTLRLICRRAYGFHSPKPLIALAFLTLGGLRPPLPGRAE